jgi:hypothetical protein
MASWADPIPPGHGEHDHADDPDPDLDRDTDWYPEWDGYLGPFTDELVRYA